MPSLSARAFFGGAAVDLPALSAWLDALDDAARVAAVRELTAREQARLFDAAKGFRLLTLADFVPKGAPPLREVVHAGRNSLPLFKDFQKRFCRPRGETTSAGKLWGYNHNTGLARAAGPGYFVSYELGNGEVLIDYLQVPPEKPASWPAIRPNSAGLSRFVYYGMQDTMRGVSQHVSVGRAARGGKAMDNWFVLCRTA